MSTDDSAPDRAGDEARRPQTGERSWRALKRLMRATQREVRLAAPAGPYLALMSAANHGGHHTTAMWMVMIGVGVAIILFVVIAVIRRSRSSRR